MSRQSWSEQIFWAVADGAQIVSTATETIIFPDVTIPANYMADGRTLSLEAEGRWSNVVTATPTLTFFLRWGGVGGTLLAQTPAITTTSSAITSAPWGLKLKVQTRTNGASGSLFVMGAVSIGNGVAPTFGTVTNYGLVVPMHSAGTTVPAAVTVDLTADTALSLTAKFSASNAANNLTGHIYCGRSEN
jgi:hypothetical protein